MLKLGDKVRIVDRAKDVYKNVDIAHIPEGTIVGLDEDSTTPYIADFGGQWMFFFRYELEKVD